ncbi:hypothetical protein pb186bvf_010920 [Paramecium bursaria]
MKSECPPYFTAQGAVILNLFTKLSLEYFHKLEFLHKSQGNLYIRTRDFQNFQDFQDFSLFLQASFCFLKKIKQEESIPAFLNRNE